MGHWRPYSDFYGRTEHVEWVPAWRTEPQGEWRVKWVLRGSKKMPQTFWVPNPQARRPDWPADPDPTNPDFRLGILPPPCPICGGQLLRWVSNATGATITYYDQRCYRGPHRVGRHLTEPSTENRPPDAAPTRGDDGPDLLPALEVVP